MLTGWVQETIEGKAVDVFMPSGARAAVLFLHPLGLESPADNAAYSAAFTKHNLVCVAPHGARSWWADRICPEFDATLTAERHLLDNVRPWMAARWPQIAAAGISMGGQGAVRLGFKYPEWFPVVASVAGAFDYHELYGQGSPLDEMYRSRENCRQDTAILHVNPLRFPPHVWFACDPDDEAWYRGNDRLHDKLSAIGLAHTADLETRAGGHSWAYFDAMAEPMLAFVAAALEKQARRLI